MPKVRAGADAKWVRRTSSATEEFKQGVQQPRVDWATATLAAAPVHAKAVTASLAAGSYSKGVQKAGSAKWQSKAAGKGADRFGPGVADAQAEYQQGVQPYLDVINNTSLPPRGPVGDPANFQRVIVMANALRNKKMGK